MGKHAVKRKVQVGMNRSENFWWRILVSAPFLVLFALAALYMGPQHYNEVNLAEVAATRGWIDEDGSVPVKMSYTGFRGFDSFVGMYVAAFTPGMAGLDESGIDLPKDAEYGSLYAPQRLLSITFLAELNSINAIWTIESCRQGNSGTVAKLALIFGILMQVAGMGHLSQLYYLISYVVMRPSKYLTSSNRHIPSYYAKTLTPALLIGYVIPTMLSYWPTFTLSTLQSWNFIWQLWPIWIVLSHQIFAFPIRFISTIPTSNAQLTQSNKDNLSYLRLTYLFSALVSAAAYNYVRFVTPVSLFQLFFGDAFDPWWEFFNLTQGVGQFLKYDYVFGFLGTVVWILLFFADLKSIGKMETGWRTIVAAVFGIAWVVGPGATVAVLWGWREEILAKMDQEEDVKKN